MQQLYEKWAPNLELIFFLWAVERNSEKAYSIWKPPIWRWETKWLILLSLVKGWYLSIFSYFQQTIQLYQPVVKYTI